MPIFKKRTVRELGEKKKDIRKGLWVKCPSCGETLFEQALSKNMRICTECGHHFTLSAEDRVASIVDEGTFEETDSISAAVDPLEFKGYPDKVSAYREKTGLDEAVLTGKAEIGSHPVVLGVMDFRFLGASMGSVVGEKITRAIELATAEKRAVILFSSSGGARMHEGIISLMQMAKTSGALALHAQAGLPFISVLTHPTTGGVTASFATLGDIIIAEPKCMIGFAGPRVVKETTHQDLPPGFQTAEFMMEHGLVDLIVERQEMREQLSRVLGYILPKSENSDAA